MEAVCQKVFIAMNAFDNGNYNSAIKLNRLIYGESVLLPIREAAQRIRSSERYAGMYDYQNEYGKCPVIVPEQPYANSGMLYNVLEPEKVTAANVDRFNGILGS